MTIPQAASPGAVDAEKTRADALELRAGGANYRQIATMLKIAVATAYKYVNEGYEELRLFNDEQKAEVKRLELYRLDAMLLKLWSKRDQPRHADTILRIMERRAKLLGLDEPIRWEGSGPNGGPLPIGTGDLDLSKLSLEELRALEQIVAHASVVAQAGAPVASIAAGPSVAEEDGRRDMGLPGADLTAADDDRARDAGVAVLEPEPEKIPPISTPAEIVATDPPSTNGKHP